MCINKLLQDYVICQLFYILAAVTTNFLYVGTLKSFGIFFVEILAEFQESVSVTSLINGIQTAMYCTTCTLIHKNKEMVYDSQCHIYQPYNVAQMNYMPTYSFNIWKTQYRIVDYKTRKS